MIRLAINGTATNSNNRMNGIQALSLIFQSRIVGRRGLSNGELPGLTPGVSKWMQRIISPRHVEMRYDGMVMVSLSSQNSVLQ